VGKLESAPGKALPEPSPAPLANPSALAQESRLLAGAIHKLRQERNPGQALAMLDQHRARFGARGALEPEAEVTRIEALLRLGRHDQALELLDGQVLTATGVGREMLVARAELRAEKGRCGAALNDFNLLLATEAAPDLVTERALYGRATCRAQQGDWAGARSDLEHYLTRFPSGRFANQARVAIGK
jgi:TolA-binding protein